MKSLEIVNYKISLFKKDKQGFTALSWFQLNDIKQDLDVLEILNNKNVELGFLKFLLSRETDLNEILEGYNYGGIGKKYLSMEELIKLKQWLEVNE